MSSILLVYIHIRVSEWFIFSIWYTTLVIKFSALNLLWHQFFVLTTFNCLFICVLGVWIFFWYHLMPWNSKPPYFLCFPKRGKESNLNFEMKSLFFNLESRDIAGNMLLMTCVTLWLSDCLKGNGHDRDIVRSRLWA